MMPEEDSEVKDAMDSLATWFRLLTIGGIIAFCSTVTVAIGLYQYQKVNDENRREAIEQERISRAVQVCVQENEQIERERLFDEEQIVQVIEIFSDSGLSRDHIREKYSEQLVSYREFIDESFPYRNCSKECVNAYLDASIKDCPTPETKPG